MRMTAIIALVEPAEEAEPPNAVVDEAVARLGRRNPLAPASPRLRPPYRSGLDLRLGYPIAVLEVQKTHQAQLVVGTLAQG